MMASSQTSLAMEKNSLIRGPFTSCPPTRTPSDSPMKLQSMTHLPPWYQKPYILTSYRPVTPSVQGCLRTILTLHNETLNIYTHLIPGIIFAFLAMPRGWDISMIVPWAQGSDELVLRLNCGTAAVCFLVSAAYHTLHCHSEGAHDSWVRCDYAGILMQISGCFFTGIWVGFYCEDEFRMIHSGINMFFCVFGATVVLNPKLRTPKWRLLRLGTFVSIGLSAVLPLGHLALIKPYHELEFYGGLNSYYLEGVLVLLGAYLYAIHFPECWRPGSFDLVGNSHQLFHICVALAAVIHIYGVIMAMKAHVDFPNCPVYDGNAIQ